MVLLFKYKSIPLLPITRACSYYTRALSTRAFPYYRLQGHSLITDYKGIPKGIPLLFKYKSIPLLPITRTFPYYLSTRAFPYYRLQGHGLII